MDSSSSASPRSHLPSSPGGTFVPLNVDAAVRDRYSRAAHQPEAQLCCPTEYDGRLLEIIPREILERDYGCGDPSRSLGPGETVLDLGSGGGKICYIAAQIVGRDGRVIGIDSNDDMLALARRYQPEVAGRLGFDNVEFRNARIQDLRLDLDLLERHLAEHPVRTSGDWLRLDEHARHLRLTAPLVADESVDVIISNCVLNLVRPEDRRQLFAEMHRVLRRGGRAVISDIVSDQDVPERLQHDPQLWSGCLSGAFREDRLLAAFEDAGFYGCEIVERQTEAWALVEGIEFRSVTVRACKGKEGPSLERRHGVSSRGPWKAAMHSFDDLAASRREWIDRMLKPWCRQAALKDLRDAEGEWHDIAGRVDPQATLWTWAWGRFPELVHEGLPGLDESSEVRVTLRDGRAVTGYPDGRRSRQGRLVLVSPRTGERGFDELGPFAIDEIVSVGRLK